MTWATAAAGVALLLLGVLTLAIVLGERWRDYEAGVDRLIGPTSREGRRTRAEPPRPDSPGTARPDPSDEVRE